MKETTTNVKPLVITYSTLQEDYLDYIKSAETVQRRFGRMACGFVGLGLVAGLVILPLTLNSDPPLLLFLLGVLPFAVLMAICPYFTSPTYRTKVLSRAVIWNTSNRMRATESALQIIEFRGPLVGTPKIFTRLKWEGINYYREISSSFVIVSGIIAHIVPKRSMDDNQIGDFRALLQRKLPRR